MSILAIATAIYVSQSETTTTYADDHQNDNNAIDVNIATGSTPHRTQKPRRPKVVESDIVCNPWISVWQREHRLIYILGTNHGKPYSVQLACDLVRNVRPKAVFVELDYHRLVADMFRFIPTAGKAAQPRIWLVPEEETLQDWEAALLSCSSLPVPKFRQLELHPVSSEFGHIIQRMYHRIDHDVIKQDPCEFIRAIHEGQAVGATIVLGDRDLRITHALQVKANQQDHAMAVAGVNYVEFSSNSTLLPREDVRRYNARLLQAGPANYQTTLVQRDAYMAAGLDSLHQFTTTVAIMGKSHVFGVEERLQAAGWKPVRLSSCSSYKK